MGCKRAGEQESKAHALDPYSAEKRPQNNSSKQEDPDSRPPDSGVGEHRRASSPSEQVAAHTNPSRHRPPGHSQSPVAGALPLHPVAAVCLSTRPLRLPLSPPPAAATPIQRQQPLPQPSPPSSSFPEASQQPLSLSQLSPSPGVTIPAVSHPRYTAPRGARRDVAAACPERRSTDPQPTTASSSQEQPTAANSSQQQPTAANSSQQQPTAAASNCNGSCFLLRRVQQC